jgi:hypothetical protein
MTGARSQAMWVAAAAALEVVTGVGLVVALSVLARLLFGSEMNVTGDLVGRISGLVMLCLAIACWPRTFEGEDRQVLAPLLAMSLLAAVYLIYIGIGGVNVGVLLWPAAAAHLILGILMARAWEPADGMMDRRRKSLRQSAGRLCSVAEVLERNSK